MCDYASYQPCPQCAAEEREEKKRDKEIERYERICRSEAPYPLNYLPSGDGQQRVLGMVVGMLIDKGYFGGIFK